VGKFLSIEKAIDELILIEPKSYKDQRGFFAETYNKRDFEALGITNDFVQDNHSMSSKGVLRGLHFQSRLPQAKLVSVIYGRVFDVAVDLRAESHTYLKWYGTELSEKNGRIMYIPERFAHGFLALEDNTHFVYKVSNYYNGQYDTGIRFDDPNINISWPHLDTDYNISIKDLRLPNLLV